MGSNSGAERAAGEWSDSDERLAANVASSTDAIRRRCVLSDSQTWAPRALRP
jgi:hypothetical protein